MYLTSSDDVRYTQNVEVLDSFVDAIAADPRIEPHGLILQQHGRRILETYWHPHRRGQLRLVYSLSKTFTGTALGLAVGDGLLSLDDKVVDLLPDLAAEVDEHTARMTVRHLASMATGHAEETLLTAMLADPDDLVGSFLRLPPQHEPGTCFAYNQPPVLALSTILHRVTGRRLVDQLRSRVLDPIGIGDLRWAQYRPGVDVGFSGVFTDLDAIARLGQLYLDDGMWAGRRILPEGWVREASRLQTDNSWQDDPDWSLGYGIQLWMCRHGFRGDGAFGQYMIVIPEADAVVAFFSHTLLMQSFMDLVWEQLLPALLTDTGWSARPEVPPDTAERSEVPAHRTLPTASALHGADAALDAVADGRFAPEPGTPVHPSIIAVEVRGDMLLIHERTDGDAAGRESGDPMYVPLRREWTDVPDHPIAASAAVDGDGRLLVDLAVLASPHRLEMTLDPTTSTFRAQWPVPPLFGLGLADALHRMCPPER